MADWVREGPTLEQHKVVRWRLVDLRDAIERQFDVHLHERTVGKLMKRLNFARVSVRPRHPDQDVDAQTAHKKRMARPVRKQFVTTRSDQSTPTYPVSGT